jgi:hypothetical protein
LLNHAKAVEDFLGSLSENKRKLARTVRRIVVFQPNEKIKETHTVRIGQSWF